MSRKKKNPSMKIESGWGALKRQWQKNGHLLIQVLKIPLGHRSINTRGKQPPRRRLLGIGAAPNKRRNSRPRIPLNGLMNSRNHHIIKFKRQVKMLRIWWWTWWIQNRLNRKEEREFDSWYQLAVPTDGTRRNEPNLERTIFTSSGDLRVVGAGC